MRTAVLLVTLFAVGCSTSVEPGGRGGDLDLTDESDREWTFACGSAQLAYPLEGLTAEMRSSWNLRVFVDPGGGEVRIPGVVNGAQVSVGFTANGVAISTAGTTVWLGECRVTAAPPP